MAAAGEDERAELEVEVAGILCDLKKILRARDRRRRRRMQRQQREKEAQVVPSWGRRRLRSVLEDGKPSAAPARVAERDGAASPDTPLAFPDSVPEEEDNAEKKARAQEEVSSPRDLRARAAAAVSSAESSLATCLFDFLFFLSLFCSIIRGNYLLNYLFTTVGAAAARRGRELVAGEGGSPQGQLSSALLFSLLGAVITLKSTLYFY